MKPYYDDGRGIVIYHGDALAVMADLPAGTYPCIITDPPYGTRTHQRNKWMVGEFANVMPLALPEMHRLATDDAAFYCFTSWRWMADWIIRCSVYFRMQGFLVWDKGRHSGLWAQYSWQFCWEGIYYGIKGARTIRKYMPDVLRGRATTSEPMQKPVDILTQLIEASTDMADVILDPFAGTGSTMVAAKILGRPCVGIEIEERYCEIAARRLSQEVLPLEVS